MNRVDAILVVPFVLTSRVYVAPSHTPHPDRLHTLVITCIVIERLYAVHAGCGTLEGEDGN